MRDAAKGCAALWQICLELGKLPLLPPPLGEPAQSGALTTALSPAPCHCPAHRQLGLIPSEFQEL